MSLGYVPFIRKSEIITHVKSSHHTVSILYQNSDLTKSRETRNPFQYSIFYFILKNFMYLCVKTVVGL